MNKLSSILLELPGRCSVAFCAMSFASVVLARLGIFNGPALIVLGAILFVCVKGCPLPRNLSPHFFTLLVMAVIFSLYAGWFTTTEIWTGRDNGVYAIIAHTASQYGFVNVNVPEIQTATDAIGDQIRNGYPGIFKGGSGLQAQFAHMSALFRAIFVDLFGQELGLAISNIAIVFVTILAFGALATSVAGWWGVAATMLLAGNAAVIYVARSSLSEMFSLAFVAICFFYCRALIRNPSSTWLAFMASVAFGGITMSRVDGYLLVPIIPIVAFAMMRADAPRRTVGIFICGSAMMMIWSAIDLRLSSSAYFHLMASQYGMKIALLGAAFAVIVSLTIIIIPRHLWSRYGPAVERIAIGASIAGVPVVAAVLAFEVWGALTEDQSGLDKFAAFAIRAPAEMLWYLPVPLILLSYIGAARLVIRERLLGSVLVVPFLLIFVFYLTSTVISADHPWNARRWVPILIPFTILIAAAALTEVKRYKSLISILAVCSVAIYGFQNYRLANQWAFTPLQRELQATFDNLAARLRDEGATFYVANYSPVASALSYFYNIPTVTIKGGVANLPLVEVANLSGECAPNVKPTIGGEHVSILAPVIELDQRCLHGRVYAPTQ